MESYTAADLIDVTTDLITDLAREGARFDPNTPYTQGTILTSELPHAVERLRTLQVVQWRENGLSWPQIGDALGVSHQAARQRYKPEIEALIADHGLVTTAV